MNSYIHYSSLACPLCQYTFLLKQLQKNEITYKSFYLSIIVLHFNNSASIPCNNILTQCSLSVKISA